MEGKVCGKCEEWKVFDEFNKCKSKKNGYQSSCKQCYKEYNQTNQEKISQQRKKYRQSNKEKMAEYRQTNKEKLTKQMKEYRQSEQGKAARYKIRIKRLSYKHKVNFTPHERKHILDRDNWSCQCCGIEVHDESIGKWNTPNKCHIDHIVPISKGGNSESRNLRVLCRTCNLSKGDKVDEQLQLII